MIRDRLRSTIACATGPATVKSRFSTLGGNADLHHRRSGTQQRDQSAGPNEEEALEPASVWVGGARHGAAGAFPLRTTVVGRRDLLRKPRESVSSPGRRAPVEGT